MWHNSRVVSCGQCLACRINKTTRTTVRLLAEQTKYEKTSFLTLTYDDDHNEDPSLRYEHLKKFWKDIRYDLGKNYDFKYYAVGEYGEISKRKHFHAILFGVGTDRNSRSLIADNWHYCNPDKFIIPAYNGLAPATRCDMQYVAGYVQKKLTGVLGKQEYQDQGFEPPDSRSSQGIGYRWFKENLDLIYPDGTFRLWNGVCVTLDKKFLERIGYPMDIGSDYWNERVKIADKANSLAGFDQKRLSDIQKIRLAAYASYRDLVKNGRDYGNAEVNYLAKHTIGGFRNGI